MTRKICQNLSHFKALIALLCCKLKQKSPHPGLGPFPSSTNQSNDREHFCNTSKRFQVSHHKFEPLLAPLPVSVHFPMTGKSEVLISSVRSSYSDSVLLYIQQQQHPLFVLCFLSERTSGVSPVIFSSDRSSYSIRTPGFSDFGHFCQYIGLNIYAFIQLQ